MNSYSVQVLRRSVLKLSRKSLQTTAINARIEDSEVSSNIFAANIRYLKEDKEKLRENLIKRNVGLNLDSVVSLLCKTSLHTHQHISSIVDDHYLMSTLYTFLCIFVSML